MRVFRSFQSSHPRSTTSVKSFTDACSHPLLTRGKRPCLAKNGSARDAALSVKECTVCWGRRILLMSSPFPNEFIRSWRIEVNIGELEPRKMTEAQRGSSSRRGRDESSIIPVRDNALCLAIVGTREGSMSSIARICSVAPDLWRACLDSLFDGFSVKNAESHPNPSIFQRFFLNRSNAWSSRFLKMRSSCCVSKKKSQYFSRYPCPRIDPWITKLKTGRFLKSTKTGR
jgi:hypothetical protein